MNETAMADDIQYWCYINNNEEFEYIKNLPQVKYINSRLKHFPEFPSIFNLDLRKRPLNQFWVFDSDSNFPKRSDFFIELSFEEMKAQIFIHQLTM